MMSTILHDATMVHDATKSHERPAWASSTTEPEDGSHYGTVTVGPVTLSIGQDIPFTGESEPIHVWLDEIEMLVGAQACRDLAAALLEAARIIEAAAA